jgi:Flp pilus assembly protein TadG
MAAQVSPLARARAAASDGAAMLEFILVLPFIFIVLVLIFNFGQGFLARHRALVAVREIGLRYSLVLAESRSGSPFEDTARQVESEILAPRQMTANVERRPNGTCPAATDEQADGGALSDAFKDMASVLGRISSSSTYNITVTAPPLTGRLLANRTFRSCFAVDSGTWTKHETGGPLDWVKSLVGKFGDIVGGLFK